MRVSIIGSGYVGIAMGTCLAKLDNKVTLIDIDKELTEAIIYILPGLHTAWS
jgi:UDP-glucose 6-dehydrogenase